MWFSKGQLHRCLASFAQVRFHNMQFLIEQVSKIVVESALISSKMQKSAHLAIHRSPPSLQQL